MLAAGAGGGPQGFTKLPLHLLQASMCAQLRRTCMHARKHARTPAQADASAYRAQHMHRQARARTARRSALWSTSAPTTWPSCCQVRAEAAWAVLLGHVSTAYVLMCCVEACLLFDAGPWLELFGLCCRHCSPRLAPCARAHTHAHTHTRRFKKTCTKLACMHMQERAHAHAHTCKNTHSRTQAHT